MPTNYMDMFGGGGLGAHFALQDRDRTEATRQAQQAGIQQNTRSVELSNLFAEQNNPQRIEQYGVDTEAKRLANENQGYINQLNSTKATIDKATGAAQLNAAQQKYIKEAKQSDVDLLELSAQQMAYDPDPVVRKQGEELMSMHRDFVKIRAEGTENRKTTAANEAVKYQYGAKLENLRSDNMDAREQNKIKAKAAASSTISKMTTDQKRSYFIDQMMAAQAAGDDLAYQQAAQMVDYITKMRASERTDTQAGKPTISPEGGLTQIPPRAPVVAPPMNSSPSPQPPPQQSLQSVMQMYPGVPAEKLREAYKKKFGVDLK